MQCGKDVESKNPKAIKKKNGRVILLPKCSVCDSRKSTFIKEQEARLLLYSLGLRTPLSQIPIVGQILFLKYKMNEIINKSLLAGYKFMPEIHLRKPGFTCGPFTKNKKRIQ